MQRHRGHRIRLGVTLSLALCLAGALMYTSFSAADPTVSPTALLKQAQPGRAYELTGVVVPHSVSRQGELFTFQIADRAGGEAVTVHYTGEVPDTFREGREVIVTVRRGAEGAFIGEPNSLISKCPSKYKVAPPSGSRS